MFRTSVWPAIDSLSTIVAADCIRKIFIHGLDCSVDCPSAALDFCLSNLLMLNTPICTIELQVDSLSEYQRILPSLPLLAAKNMVSCLHMSVALHNLLVS
jgi:hypothetical protein